MIASTKGVSPVVVLNDMIDYPSFSEEGKGAVLEILAELRLNADAIVKQ